MITQTSLGESSEIEESNCAFVRGGEEHQATVGDEFAHFNFEKGVKYKLTIEKVEDEK